MMWHLFYYILLSIPRSNLPVKGVSRHVYWKTMYPSAFIWMWPPYKGLLMSLVKCHSKGSTSWGYKLPPRHPCWGSSESSAKMSRLLANRSLAARVLVSPNQAPLYQKTNLIFQQIRRQLSWGANGNKMSDEEYNGAGGKKEIHVLSW